MINQGDPHFTESQSVPRISKQSHWCLRPCTSNNKEDWTSLSLTANEVYNKPHLKLMFGNSFLCEQSKAEWHTFKMCTTHRTKCNQLSIKTSSTSQVWSYNSQSTFKKLCEIIVSTDQGKQYQIAGWLKLLWVSSFWFHPDKVLQWILSPQTTVCVLNHEHQILDMPFYLMLEFGMITKLICHWMQPIMGLASMVCEPPLASSIPVSKCA